MEVKVYAGKELYILRKKEIQLEVYAMLKTAVNKGVQLYVEGELSSPEKIVRECCLNEDNIYMPDYVTNGNGKLVELRYDKISMI